MTIFREELDSLHPFGMSFVSVDPLFRDEIGRISSLLFHVSRWFYKFDPLLPMQNRGGLKRVLLHSPWFPFACIGFGLVLRIKMILSHILILLNCLLLILSELNYLLWIVFFHTLVNSPRPLVVFILRVAWILSQLFDLSLLLLFRDCLRLLLRSHQFVVKSFPRKIMFRDMSGF